MPHHTSMRSEFRPTSAADAEAITELLVEVFGAASTHSGMSRAAMSWKYWRPHPFWEGSRSYVLERDGRMLAHGAVVPQWCRWKAHRFRAFHLIDWAALPGAPGVGTSLFRRMLQLADAGYVVGGSDTAQRVLPALSFKEVGKATRYVRPVNPLKRLTGGGPPTWRTVAQCGRSAVWAALAPSTPPSGWKTIRSSSDASGLDNSPLPRTDPYSVVFERTPQLFAFLASCPLAQVQLFSTERNSTTRGYFLLAAVPGQVRIADCWLESIRSSDWRDLYLAAVAEARACADAAEVVTMVTDDLRRHALQQAGFHARGDHPIRFFARNPALSEVPALPCEMIDSDALYIDAGKFQFWA
jgi:hypothetical protein